MYKIVFQNFLNILIITHVETRTQVLYDTFVDDL